MDTFCVLPWFSRENTRGRNTPCCLLPENHDIEKIKSDLISGIRSPACQKCWTIEDQKQESRRVQENRFLDWKLDRDIEKIKNDCVNGAASISMYQLNLSTLCNQACVTCNSKASTKWAEIERKMGIVPLPVYYTDVDGLDIDFTTAQRINLLGGEPMFDPRSFQILEKLLKNGNDQCFISFVTNGSIHLNNSQKDMLKAFRNLNICFSIDGIEKRFEYMRWPGRWNDLLENLQQYRTITDNFSVSYTISSVNAIYYDETVEWLDQNSLKYNHNIVYDPIWASLDAAPMSIKNQIKDHEFFKNLISFNGKELSNIEWKNILVKQDTAKNIDFKNYLPELASLLNS